MFVLANTVANTVSSPFQRIGRIVWTPVLTEPALSIHSPSFFCSCLSTLVCAGHISSRKGKYCEMASISRSIPFFCPEIPDSITNEYSLRKDDNLGLRGCITLNTRFCLRRFLPLTRFVNLLSPRIPSLLTRIFTPNHFSRTFLCPKFAINAALKQLFPVTTSLYGILPITLSTFAPDSPLPFTLVYWQVHRRLLPSFSHNSKTASGCF